MNSDHERLICKAHSILYDVLYTQDTYSDEEIAGTIGELARELELALNGYYGTEVVTCADCALRGDYEHCPVCHREEIHNAIVHHDNTQDDWFCSCGERKESE